MCSCSCALLYSITTFLYSMVFLIPVFYGNLQDFLYCTPAGGMHHALFFFFYFCL